MPGAASHWGVTRTGAHGVESYNDFTVVRRPGPDGTSEVSLHDLNRSGFQPLPAEGLGVKEDFHATIIGDPHFAVQGTVNGEQKDVKFDNQDLGDRSQYRGAGFQLETNTVPWGDQGAAVVGSATVSTGFGRAKDEVTVGADGNLSVNGEQTTMEAGQSMQLNRTSSVTMDESGNYTVSSRNGKVSNTLSPMDGGYLNIDSTVKGVQTVGWLQNQG